jgi:hypothetical protein
MYYFTIKNNTIYNDVSNSSTYYIFDELDTYYIFDYVNGILYEKRYLHNAKTLLRKTTLNNILEYYSTYNRRVKWEYFDELDFSKCNDIIIEWDFYLDGDHITFLQNILYKAITEIRNQKIEQILNE